MPRTTLTARYLPAGDRYIRFHREGQRYALMCYFTPTTCGAAMVRADQPDPVQGMLIATVSGRTISTDRPSIEAIAKNLMDGILRFPRAEVVPITRHVKLRGYGAPNWRRQGE